MKRVLITGGLGFIGFHLANTLLDDGHSVCVVDWDGNQIARTAELLKRTASVEICSFNSPKIITDIQMETYDFIFHLAATPRVSYSVEYPHETNHNNVVRTLDLLEAARVGKVKRFVFSSSSSVYGGASILPTPENYPKSPKSPYALQKSVIEDYCKLYSRLYGIDTACLRYFNVFGPGAKGEGAYATAISAWIHAVKTDGPLRFDGDGKQSRDLCPVENVVRANILAMEYGGKLDGECFNVACGERTSNSEILSIFLKKFPHLNVVAAPWRPGDVMHTHADISKAKRILGYEPKILFREALENTINKELGE